MKTFYLSFGAGYRRSDSGYDGAGMAMTGKANKHPFYHDKVDGRGYVVVEAEDVETARQLVWKHFDKYWSEVYADTSMWDEWETREMYPTNPWWLRQENGGSLVLGRLTADGLIWSGDES